MDVPTLIRIAVILCVAGGIALVARIARRRVERRLRNVSPEPNSPVRKRAQTLSGIVSVLALTLVWTTALFMVLAEAGVSIGPLLAAAGVGGIAIGFGAQSLVRDVISGFFILLENHFDVGDVVQVAGVAGLVESMSLRTSVLRDLEGRRHVVPNGEIRVSTNLTKEFSRYLVDVPVPYEEDPDAVAQVARRVADGMSWDAGLGRDLRGPVSILGVEDYADSSLTLRMYLETAPGRQWAVGREFRRRLRAALHERGISIPYPHREVRVRPADDGPADSGARAGAGLA